MNKTYINLYLVCVAFICNLALVPVLEKYAEHLVWYAILSLMFIVLPLYVLCGRAAVAQLSIATSIKPSHKAIVWFVACFLQIVFGLMATSIGAIIILSILFSALIAREPDFIAGLYWGGFAFGPLLFMFGLFALKSLQNKWKSAVIASDNL